MEIRSPKPIVRMAIVDATDHARHLGVVADALTALATCAGNELQRLQDQMREHKLRASTFAEDDAFGLIATLLHLVRVNAGEVAESAEAIDLLTAGNAGQTGRTA